MDYNGCVELDCPVHLRNNSELVNEVGHLELITYAGEFAVFSHPVANVAEEEAAELRIEVIAMLISGESTEEQIRDIDRRMKYRTQHTVYKVGHGAISDVADGFPYRVEYGELESTEEEHDSLVVRAYSGKL